MDSSLMSEERPIRILISNQINHCFLSISIFSFSAVFRGSLHFPRNSVVFRGPRKFGVPDYQCACKCLKQKAEEVEESAC
jgi:hypothetical protein